MLDRNNDDRRPLETFKIASDKIGIVIGGRGRTIKAITEATRTQIDIEQGGMVRIFGGEDADGQRAARWVKTLAGQIEVNDEYRGKVRRVTDFGIFVELVPGLDGLVHISNIPQEMKNDLAAEFEYGTPVLVSVRDYNAASGRVGLKLIEKLSASADSDRE